MPSPTLLPAAGTDAWLRVDGRIAATVLAHAEALHAEPAVLPTASEWAQFRANGNRANYESRLFKLQDRMATAALAACLAPDAASRERWAGVAADDAWALCELSSWCLPAHYPSGAKDRNRDLPDILDPVLDLDAGTTGALLAWAGQLLQSQWEQAFPSLLDRVRGEIRQRVMAPFLGRAHYWFGSPQAPPNNWAPWITANAMACFLVLGTPEEQRRAVEVAVPVMENFKSGYGPDGACEEGATYWWVAALTLFEALDFIRTLSGGEVDQLGEPLLAAMGRYPHQMQVHDHWQVNFGDASPHMATDVRFHAAHRYAVAVGDADSALFARSMGAVAGQSAPASWEVPALTGRNFHRVVMELLDPDWMATDGAGGDSRAAAPMPYPATTFLSSTEVLCARETAGSNAGLFLAVKGGNNGVSHNHNDAGGFTVFHNGVPVIIDLGVETYSKATFSPDRYSIWTMRSGFHNVPRINGAEQLAGHGFAATRLESWGTDGPGAPRTGLAMNLERAYGDVAGLGSWRRSAELDREQRLIRIHDAWTGTKVRPKVTLMLAAEPQRVAENSLAVAGTVITHSPGWSVALERHEVTDARLVPVWGQAVYRAVLTPMSGADQLEVSVRAA